MTLVSAVIAGILFAFFDYTFYNTLGQKKLTLYRVIQTAFQILLVVALWFVGPLASVLFMLLWWTWNCDLLYYFFCYILHWYSAQPKNSFEQYILSDTVTWAWWTPYGLIRGHKSEPIDGDILVIQASAGIILSIVLQYLS